jgi:hypothetical protein
MKNLDLFSRRVLSISIGLSMVLMSLSLLFISFKNITTANAGTFEKKWVDKEVIHNINHLMQNDSLNTDEESDEMIKAIHAFGIGIREGNLYFGILYSNNSIGIHKAPAEGEDVLEW